MTPIIIEQHEVSKNKKLVFSVRTVLSAKTGMDRALGLFFETYSHTTKRWASGTSSNILIFIFILFELAKLQIEKDCGGY